MRSLIYPHPGILLFRVSINRWSIQSLNEQCQLRQAHINSSESPTVCKLQSTPGSTTMPPQISVIFVLGRFSYPPPLRIIESQDSKFSPIGPPGAGKGTLSALLAENFPVQHISVGDLLRRIKNDITHPQAGALAPMLNKQELIDAKVLVPILRNELEGSESREQGRRVVLVDGFPRNLAQRRGFEEAVSMLASKASSKCTTLCPNAASSSQNPDSFYSSTVLKKSRSSAISHATWKGGRRMTRQCSRNDMKSMSRRMRISCVNIRRGDS